MTIDDRSRIEAFAAERGLSVLAESDRTVFGGWLTLWPPEAKCFAGQTGWLAGELKSFGNGWDEPRDYEEDELGEFPTLGEALEAIAARHEGFEQYATAETPNDGSIPSDG